MKERSLLFFYGELDPNGQQPAGISVMSKTPITTDVRSGASTLNELPEILRKYGTKVLLVHGHRPVEDGLLQTVRLLLNEAGFPHANMGQILAES